MTKFNGNTPTALRSGLNRIPPHAYFVGAAIFHYLGPAFAVLLFARVAVPGVAWLRIVSAAAIFAAWRRPWRILLDAGTPVRRDILLLGVVFGVMNYVFYIAIDRLPLATVASIEFIGPILLAAVGVRTRRNLVALGAAVVGVYVLTGIRVAGDPRDLLWAVANAALFTVYIVLAHRLSTADPSTSPIDRLGAAMLVAGVVITPLGLTAALPALTDPIALWAGIGVGVSSSVIPYVFDQLAMARLPRPTYSLFVAILPATAVIVGLVVLRQAPSAADLAGVGCVMAGVLLHQAR